MSKFLSKITYPFKWIYTTIHLMMIRISIGMYNTEQEILKADPNGLSDKNKKNQKVITRNPLHRKMEQGHRDERYVKDYYEVLKKADKFLRNSTPNEIEVAAAKHGMNVGKTDAEMRNVGSKKKAKKDKWGRRYDHFGFFDPKSKNYGKTMAEVMVEETKERLTKDDDYSIEFMFSNKPSNIGLLNNENIIEDDKLGYRELNSYEKSKKVNYPMTVQRKNEECFNKIEQLTEYLHIKSIGLDHKLLEFFIPIKYKVFDHSIDSDIFKEIIDIESVWIRDEYHNLYGYRVEKYNKRVDVIDESVVSSDDNVIYQVIKLNAIAIEKIN